MELSIDRCEKKGFFGGTYYESYIRLTLTEEEEKVAKELGLMDAPIFYSQWSKQDEQVLLLILQNEDKNLLRFERLTKVILAKSDKIALSHLDFAENRIRQKCKEFEAKIKNYISS